MRLIKRSIQDNDLLRSLVSDGGPQKLEQPRRYSGLVVMKPWGYEFELFDNGRMTLWFVCIRKGEATSMHCHQRKEAAFVPLSDGIVFHTLRSIESLNEYISVERGVFHGQSAGLGKDVYFLEYEWPSEKADLVRANDRYGRVGSGYEGLSAMVPFEDAMNEIKVPDNIRHIIGRVA